MELTNRVMRNSQPYSFLFYNRHNSLGAIDLGTEILIALPKKSQKSRNSIWQCPTYFWRTEAAAAIETRRRKHIIAPFSPDDIWR